MILEIPYTLTEGGKITSKTFRKVYYEYERSVNLFLFSISLLSHSTIEIWSLLLQLNSNKETGKSVTIGFLNSRFGTKLKTLKSLIKTWKKLSKIVIHILTLDALKCYILANRKCFRSISLSNMAQKFELEEKNIKKLVSKWIYSR